MAKNLTIAKLWLFLLVHRREVLFDLQPNIKIKEKIKCKKMN
jgi:hypothetical protein